MIYSLAYQMYVSEHGQSPAELRAAHARMGAAAAVLRDLRPRRRRSRPARGLPIVSVRPARG